MCYSARCAWEDHMGDCRFPTHVLGYKEHMKCNSTHTERLETLKLVEKYKEIRKRNQKIDKILNKISK